MRELTIFSLNVDDGISENSKQLHNFCFKTWDRLVEYFKSLNYNVQIKIYTKYDNDYINFYNEFITKTDYAYNNLRMSHIADAFRLYILSKYPYHLWLDWDVYVKPKVAFNLNYDEKIFRKSFTILYNSNDLDFFLKIYNYVMNNRLSKLGDKKLVNYLINNNVIENTPMEYVVSSILHLHWLDNDKTNYLVFTDYIDKDNEYYKQLEYWYNNDRLNRKPNDYVFISKEKEKIGKNIFKEKEVIEFILMTFNLSQEQSIKLKEWLSS